MIKETKKSSAKVKKKNKTEFDLKNRTEIAWSNTWIEQATDLKRKRFLVIGDSVPRDYRGSLSKFLPEYSVDFIGSSSIFEDTLLYDLCDLVLKEKVYRWSFVILALGGNHGNYLHTFSDKEDKKKYRASLERFLRYLRRHFADIVIVNTAPNRMVKNYRKYDVAANQEISERNSIMAEMAKKLKLNKYIDLYKYAMDNDFTFKDERHFKDKRTQEKIAQYVIKHLIECGLLLQTDLQIKKKRTLWHKICRLFKK